MIDTNINKRNFGLDLVRSIAIILVLISHLYPFLFRSNIFVETALGFYGVEIFFVLSGFLIGGIIIKENIVNKYSSIADVKNFWVRRWFRTTPNYYITLILWVIVYLVVHLFENKYFLYFIFSQNLSQPHPKFFSAAWSLAIEEWFYLLFPLAIILFNRFQKFALDKTILYSIMLFIFLFLLVRVIFFQIFSFQWNFYRQTILLRLDGIAYGVLLAYFKQYQNRVWEILTKRGFFILGIVLILVTTMVFNGILSPKSFFARTILFSLVSISIGLTIPYIYYTNFRNNFFKKGIVFISLISYSLYLSHSIIIKMIEETLPDINDYFKFSLIVILIILISYLQYRIIEVPFLKYRDRMFPPQNKVKGKI